MKIYQHALLAVVLLASTMAQAVPVQYILDGQASGSYDGTAFVNQRFGLLIDGDTETVSAASEPYVPGSNPDSKWFTQATLTRIQSLFPPTPGEPIFPPYPLSLADPGSFQLLGWNFGAYTSSTGQHSDPFQWVSLCDAGLNRYDCLGYSPAYSFQVPSFVNLSDPLGPVDVRPGLQFNFLTTRGAQLRIDTLTDARFEVRVSAVPEPETYALMLAGLGMVFGVVRRRVIARAAGVPAL